MTKDCYGNTGAHIQLHAALQETFWTTGCVVAIEQVLSHAFRIALQPFCFLHSSGVCGFVWQTSTTLKAYTQKLKSKRAAVKVFDSSDSHQSTCCLYFCHVQSDIF